MNEREKRLLRAMVYMAQQYLPNQDADGREVVDSSAMVAGEHAILALAEYGLVNIQSKVRIWGYWTQEAEEILK